MNHETRKFNRYKIYKSIVIVTSIIILVSGCASHVTVNVNAITDIQSSSTGKHYYLANKNEHEESTDLYYREFSRYFDHILQKQGYIKATEPSNADIKIIFQFGISDGRTGIQTYSWPIYETFGGQTYTVTEKTTNSQGQTITTKRTVHVPSYVRQIGNSFETRSYTIYNRYVNLTAIPANQDSNVSEQQGNVLPMWNINVHSVGENSDLRAIMPYLAAAAFPFIGKNSGQQQTMDITKDNPLVKELQQLVVSIP